MVANQKLGVLFFDLDGVIIDSQQSVENCLNKTLSEWNTPPLAAEERSGLIGPPLDQVVPQILLNRGLRVSSTPKFITDFRQTYEGVLRDTPLMQDMEETLHALARHRKLCIVTSKPESQAVQIIQARNLEKYFEFVVGSDPLYPSTKTDLLKKALSSFQGLNLLDSWMIGDRYHDIDAARNVGMNSLGVTWGYGNHTELKKAQADLIIANPGQLLEMFL